MNFKFSKLTWILAFVLPVFFMSCGDDDDTMEPEPQSIVEIAADDEQFSTLVAALTRVDLVSTLEGNGPFTVFAPNNAAFTASGVNIDDLSDEELTEVLLYHVLGAKVNAADIAEGQSYATTAAATGPGDNQLSILIEKTAAGAVTINNAVNVSTPDVDATNGVIHIIDNVILPLDVVGHASANNNFSSLVTSLEAASGDLVPTLKGAGPFTILAPLNNAFADITATTDMLDADQLSRVLLYHVASGNVRAGDLTDGMEITSLNGDLKITVGISGDTVTFTDVSGNTATVQVANVQATNGVIHAINTVLIPDNL